MPLAIRKSQGAVHCDSFESYCNNVSHFACITTGTDYTTYRVSVNILCKIIVFFNGINRL